jgi:hypothetical protein
MTTISERSARNSKYPTVPGRLAVSYINNHLTTGTDLAPVKQTFNCDYQTQISIKIGPHQPTKNRIIGYSEKLVPSFFGL